MVIQANPGEFLANPPSESGATGVLRAIMTATNRFLEWAFGKRSTVNS